MHQLLPFSAQKCCSRGNSTYQLDQTDKGWKVIKPIRNQPFRLGRLMPAKAGPPAPGTHYTDYTLLELADAHFNVCLKCTWKSNTKQTYISLLDLGSG